MSVLKSIIPDNVVLEKVAREEVDKSFETFSASVIEEYNNLSKGRSSLIFYIVLIILIPIISVIVLLITFSVDNPNELIASVKQFSAIATLFSPLLVIFLLIAVFASLGKKKNYLPEKINTYVLSSLSNLLQRNITILYEKKTMFDSGPERLLREQLQKSNLIDLSLINSIKINNIYKLDGEKDFIFHEVSLHSKNGLIFIGIFVEVFMKNTHGGTTIVSTISDTEYFQHKDSILKSIFSNNPLIEQTLEWNEFEEKISLASTNPAEARYIFTPNFMADFYDWWKTEEDNIRISFIDDKMYFLIPRKNQIWSDSTIENILKNDKEQFIMHLAVVSYPIWRTLLLVEDMKI